jgi:glucose/mannose-6-phosphate isomerase
VSTPAVPGAPVDLDDAAALEAADPGGMLRAVASSAAQVREAAVLSGEAGLARLADEDRPRSVVVCGMGGSGIAGDVLAAVAGPACRVPVLTHRGFGLPTWVGAADLVIAVSCSGSTQETLSALEEAVRRGCRLLVVGAAGSPVEDLAGRGRGLFVPVAQGRQPRASLWSLSVPLLVAADALGLLVAGPEELVETATVLEGIAQRCRPDADTLVNPGKSLAVELDGALPVVWGASPLTGTAAYRFACQLNENAGAPATWGVLPEAGHNQVVSFDGPWAGRSDEDLFRDRAEDAERQVLRLVLLREEAELPPVAERADACAVLAAERGVGVSALLAEGLSAPARLASLVGLTDYASTYLALAQGTDPTPVDVITELKRRTSRAGR